MHPFDPESFSARPATEDDLPQILAIEKLAYPEPCVPWSQQAFLEELKKPFSHFIVLTDDETDSTILGYIVYWQIFDECHILNVAVHPDWRGLGHAIRLVRLAINAAVRKDQKRLFLEVRTTNKPAIELYQRLGFFIDHTKPKFYENGDDAYFMVLYLNQKNTF